MEKNGSVRRKFLLNDHSSETVKDILLKLQRNSEEIYNSAQTFLIESIT